MTTQVGSLDAQLLDDLRMLDASGDLLEAAGLSGELWEHLSLMRSDRTALRERIANWRSERDAGRPATPDPAIRTHLDELRSRLASFVADLRAFIVDLPDPRWSGRRLDTMIALLTVSSKGLETGARWLADTERHAAEAGSKLDNVASVADRYLEMLARERPAPTQISSPAAAPGTDPEILGDLRRVEKCRELLLTGHPEIEEWELLCLVMIDREGTRKAVREVRRLQNEEGRELAVSERALALHKSLVEIRTRHGDTVRKLRGFLATLPMAHPSNALFEMALGFLMSTPRGRRHAQEWLENPEQHQRDAAGYFEDIVRRAMRYQGALSGSKDVR